MQDKNFIETNDLDQLEGVAPVVVPHRAIAGRAVPAALDDSVARDAQAETASMSALRP